MNTEVMVSYLPLYKEALFLTLRIGWKGVGIALVIGIVGAAILHFQIPIVRRITGFYIELFRNTPLLVQLFFIYFALPKIGITVSPESCGMWGLGLLGGAYMAETFRSGLESVPQIQYESSQSLGMNRIQVFRYVILPQAISSSVPGLTANVIFFAERNQCFFYYQSNGSDVYGKGSHWHVCQDNRVPDSSGYILSSHASAGFCFGQLAGKEASLCRVWGLMFCLKEQIL